MATPLETTNEPTMIFGVTLLILNAKFTVAIRYFSVAFRRSNTMQIIMSPHIYLSKQIMPEANYYSIGIEWFGLNFYALVS